MFDRRTFMKLSAILAGGSLFKNGRLAASTGKNHSHFKLNPFIEEDEKRVFIYFTDVEHKKEWNKKKEAGLNFGRSVFISCEEEENAYPVSSVVGMKPNLTERGRWQSGYSYERTYGVVTDVDFMEGLIESVKELGVASDNIRIREVNGADDLDESGYVDLRDITGADIKVVSTQANYLSGSEVVWKDVPNGVWFNQIPYLAPFNSDGTFMINISKLKAHAMGMTLCAKNLQGGIAAYYQKHCTEFENDMYINDSDIVAGAKNNIADNYRRHRETIPRWDKPGTYGGIWQEIWASRCLDNNSAFKPNLHIIEGIIGRDGHFVMGPHDGFGEDFTTNMIIFGKNPFYVDMVGAYLAGHEPGNFGLFHLALERKLIDFLNPADIDLYSWDKNSDARKINLFNQKRTPLKTYYLQRNYNGQSEDYWHLCDEEFDYSSITSIGEKKSLKKESMVDFYPNPVRDKGFFKFRLHRGNRARISVYDVTGRLVGRPVDGYYSQGVHLQNFNTAKLSSGIYFYRFELSDGNANGTLTVIK